MCFCPEARRLRYDRQRNSFAGLLGRRCHRALLMLYAALHQLAEEDRSRHKTSFHKILDH